MKQLERRSHRTSLLNFVTFSIVAASILIVNAGAVMAHEAPLPSAPPDQPAADSTAPTPENPPNPTPENSLTPENTSTPADPPVNSNDLEGRLNSLEQKLNGVEATELDPIYLVLPGITSNVPNAYGASKNMQAVGIGVQNRLRYSDHRVDGSVAALVGLSDPRELGADLQFSFLDLSRFGRRVSLGFKLHRQMANDYAVAVGGENVLVTNYSDSDPSFYAVVTKKLRLAESSSEPFSRIYLTLGIGNGRFQSETDYFNNRNGVNVFGSAAVNVNRSTSVFTEWTGQSLNVGTSFVPIRNSPLVLTLALADITGGGGDGTRVTGGLTYVFAH